MVNIQLAKTSGVIVQLDYCSVQVLKFVFTDTDVGVLTKIMPCFVKLGTWLTSKWADSVELAIVKHFLMLDGC